MEIIVAIVNLFLIGLLSWRGFKSGGTSSPVVFWTAFAGRLLAGLALGLVYQYYYRHTGDTLTFFKDATVLTELGYRDFSSWFRFILTGEAPLPLLTEEPRSVFFVTILSIVNFFTYNNYWISSLWFSLFAFWSSFRLVQSIGVWFPSALTAARIALLFVPSVVFWGSGIVKESLAFGCLAVLAVHFLTALRIRQLTFFAWTEVAFYLYVLISLKYYWAAVLVPCMLTSIIIQWTLAKRLSSNWSFGAAWLLVFSILAMIASFAHPNFYPERFLTVITENHNLYAEISKPANTIHYYNLSPDWWSMLINSPWALVSGLFRPFVWEGSGMAGVAASIETLLLLILVVWKIPFIKSPSAQYRYALMAAVAYIVVLCIFLALSTPNLGTLSRYRIGFLPFVVLLTLVDHPLLGRWSSSKVG